MGYKQASNLLPGDLLWVRPAPDFSFSFTIVSDLAQVQECFVAAIVSRDSTILTLQHVDKCGLNGQVPMDKFPISCVSGNIFVIDPKSIPHSKTAADIKPSDKILVKCPAYESSRSNSGYELPFLREDEPKLDLTCCAAEVTDVEIQTCMGGFDPSYHFRLARLDSGHNHPNVPEKLSAGGVHGGYSIAIAQTGWRHRAFTRRVEAEKQR